MQISVIHNTPREIDRSKYLAVYFLLSNIVAFEPKIELYLNYDTVYYIN
jgi:hypothetical protein